MNSLDIYYSDVGHYYVMIDQISARSVMNCDVRKLINLTWESPFTTFKKFYKIEMSTNWSGICWGGRQSKYLSFDKILLESHARDGFWRLVKFRLNTLHHL